MNIIDSNLTLFEVAKLNKLVAKVILRITKLIDDNKYIEVSSLNIKNKRPTLIKDFLINDCNFEVDKYSGLYLFFTLNVTNGKPEGLYTGISINLLVRLKDHISGGDPAVASFAVLMARSNNKELNDYFTKTAYKSKKTQGEQDIHRLRKSQLKDAVRKSQSEMNNYYLTAIPINNYQEMHATEAFVAGNFQCKYNSFRTH